MGTDRIEGTDDRGDESGTTDRLPTLAWLCLFAALGALVLAGTTASANHLSVGYDDGVGISPEETPDEKSVNQEWWDIGTTEPSKCYQPDTVDAGSPAETVGELTDAASEEGFCGKLVYEDDTDFVTTSGKDQQLFDDEIGTFDAQFVTSVTETGLRTCLPWCANAAGLAPGMDAYEWAHDAGASFGLTPDGEEAREGDRGWQTYTVSLSIANPTRIVQEEFRTHPMNGWVFPVYDQSIIGFLYDGEGNPVSEDSLESMVEESKETEDGVVRTAAPRVCGFTPDADVRTEGPDTSFCEVEFEYVAPGEGELQADPSADECESPTYVCGAATGAHWRAEVTCAFANCESAVEEANDETQDRFGETLPDETQPRPQSAPADSTLEYLRWHYVVAPSSSPCNGGLDPGFTFEVSTASGGIPYLAHDLDVYTPLAHLVNTNAGDGFTNVRDWAQRFVGDTTGGEDAQGVSDVLGSSAIPLEEERRYVAKDHRTEPNAAGDDSQQKIVVPRDDICTRVTETGETEATEDPWVNVIDSHTVPAEGPDVDAYLDGDDSQSADNRPGPNLYTTTGKLGIFADVDDDGTYDQAPADSVFSSVAEHGAYPMIWDVHLDADRIGDAQDPDDAAMQGGCQAHGFDLSGAARESGYGAETGLIQVVYLHEPTVIVERSTQEAFLEAAGDTAFVFLSEGLQTLHERGSERVQQQIDEALAAVPAEDPRVQYMYEWEGHGSDFSAQCEEGTGGFTNDWAFAHACDRDGSLCEDGTVVTRYVYETDNGEIGGAIPAFRPGDQIFDGFADEAGDAWTDVDPLDDDPSRNDDEDSSPPTGE